MMCPARHPSSYAGQSVQARSSKSLGVQARAGRLDAQHSRRLVNAPAKGPRLYALIQIIALITQVIVVLVIVQFVIGLLFSFNVVNGSNQFLVQVYRSINSLLAPVLGPIRRIMPDTG